MKTVAAVLNAFAYTIMGVVMGLFAAGIFIGIFGFLPETPLFIVVVAIVTGITIAYAFEGWAHFKARPRGLGQRRVTKWKDGAIYYEWEKY